MELNDMLTYYSLLVWASFKAVCVGDGLPCTDRGIGLGLDTIRIMIVRNWTRDRMTDTRVY